MGEEPQFGKGAVCANCRFWEHHGEAQGSCHAGRPAISGGDASDWDQGVWPRVDAGRWCGEWERDPNVSLLDVPTGKDAVIESATKVVRIASVGDQNFIECLNGDDAEGLRHAIVQLTDDLREA